MEEILHQLIDSLSHGPQRLPRSPTSQELQSFLQKHHELQAGPGSIRYMNTHFLGKHPGSSSRDLGKGPIFVTFSGLKTWPEPFGESKGHFEEAGWFFLCFLAGWFCWFCTVGCFVDAVWLSPTNIIRLVRIVMSKCAKRWPCSLLRDTIKWATGLGLSTCQILSVLLPSRFMLRSCYVMLCPFLKLSFKYNILYIITLFSLKTSCRVFLSDRKVMVIFFRDIPNCKS